MKKQFFTITAVLAMGLSLTSCYDFNREQAELDAESKGKQTLLEAESSKKAKIEEAKADLEAAKLEAETIELKATANAKRRVIEAEANAKSIEIKAKAYAKEIELISKEIQNNPDYIRVKQIEAMKTGKSVFVPTEGNMPIIYQNK